MLTDTFDVTSPTFHIHTTINPFVWRCISLPADNIELSTLHIGTHHVYVLVQPVVDHNVPGSVKARVIGHVPPVLRTLLKSVKWC